MRFDDDVHRDGDAAFGPESVFAGAILPYEGRVALQRPDGLPAAVTDADADGWAAANVPVLVRGRARIVPLGWFGDPQHAPRGVRREELDALTTQMQDAGMYWAGPWCVLDLDERRSDSIGSYADALRAAGTTSADCWTYSDTWGLVLVRAGVADEGSLSLSLHVVPSAWISESRAGKATPGVDVHWSWVDVTALYAGMDSLGSAGGEESQ